MALGNLVARHEPSPHRQSLVGRYRPRRLSDILGQPDAVRELAAYVSNPYPAAWIFAGGTGVGKTSAAWALAAELGCDIDANPPEFGGVYSIASGQHTAQSLNELWPQLWAYPMQSANGWKVLVVNEVEQVRSAVELLWLDRLDPENMPPRCAIVFTTNEVETLADRFRDRCQVLAFSSAADDLGQAARALVETIWREETGGMAPADVVARVVARATQAGRLSFRRVVQNIVPMLAQKAR
jgi:DNA polymerase III delta prime subunit